MKSLFAPFLFATLAAGSALAQSVTVTPSATTYSSAGGQITVSVAFSFATPTSVPSAMAFQITAPAGWSYAGGYSGDSALAKPVTGDTGPLGFAFSDFETQTPGKVAFSFKVNHDAGLSGTQALPVTVAQYKDGVVGTVNLTVPNVTFTSAGGGTGGVSITTQPVSQTVAAGAQATLSVVATGSPAPTFQWRRGGVALSGATNASFSIASVLVSDAGNYDVLVANTVSSVTSSGAVLTVSGATNGVFVYSSNGSSATITGYTGSGGSVTIPSSLGGVSVTAVGENAFLGNTSITSVVIPNTVLSIGPQAFGSCTGLTSVTIPQGVTSIGQGGFDNCTSLVSLALPASVTSIGSNAFRSNLGMTSITVDANNPAFSSDGKALYNKNKTTLIKAAVAGISGSYVLPSTVTSISGHAFRSCVGLTSVSLPSGLTSISADAFRGCTSLGDVTFPASVNSIGALAFTGTPSLLRATFLGNAPTLDSTYPAFSPATLQVVQYLPSSTGWSSTYSGVATVMMAGSVIAPSITTQPQSQSVTAGASVTFSVVAAGTAPLSYQWKKGTANISGATNSSYTIPATTSVDAGSYVVTVSNSAGNVTSNAALLTVTTASSFAFSQHPVAITRSRGETASFQVNATGGTGTVTYKWYKDGTALSDSFGRISGSATQTLVISNVGVADGGSYSATATTAQNGSITSNGAALTVLGGPTITRPALDAAVRASDSTTFSVSASGSGTLSYKWLFTAKNSASAVGLADVSGRLSGATSGSLTISSITSADEGFYTCEVTDSAGVARSTASLGVFSRIIRVVGQSAAPGSNITVSVQLLGTGAENAAGFSMQFDPNKLSYVGGSAALGAQSSDATLVTNEALAPQGRLGFAIAKPSNGKWVAGTNEILKMTFTIKSTLTNADVCVVGFGGAPVSQEVAGVDASVLPTGFSAGLVTPLSGFEADINGSGTLTISDWVKIGRIVAGLDPRPTGVDFLKVDTAPRTNSDGSLRLGGGTITIADWVQAGRYVAGLDPITPVGGPTDSQNP